MSNTSEGDSTSHTTNLRDNWQSSYDTVNDKMAHLLNNDTLSDVSFLVGTDENMRQLIPAHSFILSIGSCVFDAMLNGNFKEKQPIVINDTDPHIFLLLLNFLYTDEVQITPDVVIATFYLAKKYSVSTLEKMCVEFLQMNLCSDNACMLLEQAILFDEPTLANRCLSTIDNNADQSFTCSGFTELDLCNLILLVKRNSLVIDEVKLFGHLVTWAVECCKKNELEETGANFRKCLGEVVMLVRFPLMSIQQFSKEVAQSGILTDSELVQMYLYYTITPKPSIPFNSDARITSDDNILTLRRFLASESRWGYNGVTDRIRFSVNRKIKIYGFGLYGSINTPCEYVVKIQILVSKTLKVLSEANTHFKSNGTSDVNKVYFEKPVEIHADNVYLASSLIEGPDSYYGIKGQRKLCVDCPIKGCVSFSFVYITGLNNGTNVQDGQIPEIYFTIS